MGSRHAEQVVFPDSAIVDAFGRQRVSDPLTLFDSQLQYDKQPLLWHEVASTGATATHLPNESSVRLALTGASQSLVRQTYEYHRYQPGKSQLVLCTFVAGTAGTGVTKEVGYGDAKNGIFFRLDSAGAYIVKRSNVTGTVVETAVAQADWNEDEYALADWTKAQIFFCDMEWLGVGRVRTGFVTNGQFVVCHEFDHANIATGTYITTANLPVRYSITSSTGATAGSTDFKQICASVISEGGFEAERGYPASADNTGAAVTATSTVERLVLAIRPALTWPSTSIVNRTQIIPEDVNVLANQDICFRVRYDADLSGVPSTAWVESNSTIGSGSPVQYTIGSSTQAITTGRILTSRFVASGNANNYGVQAQDIGSKLPLTLSSTGGNPKNIAITAQRLTAGAATVYAGLTWRELY